ncbi:MAG TPA: phage/plasmid primase, P4 family [Candidatus Competibacteraceae bacterium]|nr:phage/plasmid primase, P4 family [Candidatus Competibacteraceae bacterium]
MAKKCYRINYYPASDRGQAIPSSRVSFEVLANACLAQAERLVAQWLPEGRREGQEWVALNPIRADSHRGSFKVNLVTGHWADFATGDKGGDLISLYGYLYGLKNGQAATHLLETMGMATSQPAATAGGSPRKQTWAPVTPVPAGAPPAPATHPKHGLPSAVWTYRDAAERVLFQVYRFDLPNGKQLLPLTYCRNPARQYAWRWQGVEAPRPLYNLHWLAARPNDWVVVNEGEKAVDAAAILLPEYVPTTSPNGCQSPHKTDWTVLSGKPVLIWPDADDAGRAYAQAVATLALKAGAASVHILNIAVFGHVPQSWDAADALAEGWTAEQVTAIVRNPANWLTPTFDGVIEHLAQLDSLAYDRRREAIAQQLGVRVTTLDTEVKEKRIAAKSNKAQEHGQTPPGLPPLTQAGLLNLPTVSPCTHLANAHRIRQYYQGRLGYALGVGWVLWTGQFWRPDPTAEGALAIGFIDELSRKIAAEASTLTEIAASETNSDRRQALLQQADSLLRWAMQSENERVIAAGLKLAKHALLLDHDQLNADPWLFNVQNGTLDLRSGRLHPHDSRNLITHLAPVSYDLTATCPTFGRFLLEVFAGDSEMVAFIQRGVGWSLTGVVEERALFFLYGERGKNGKSTLIETIMNLLGVCGETSFGYARKVTADTFMKSRNQDDNQRKAATLAGPRFICTSEVSEEQRLNEQLIKDITGGDTLEARKLYQEAFTFKPQFKAWMYGNHKPQIRGTDDAIWSRVKLIPFEVSFAGREDTKLPTKLKEELPGILNWALRGCLDWQRHGLNPPAKVQAATQAYREEMDMFSQFIKECCVIRRDASVWASELKAAYQSWCADNGVREETQTKFGRYLTAKGYPPDNLGGRKRRLGIGLLLPNECCHDSYDSYDSCSKSFPQDSPIETFPSNYHNCHDCHETLKNISECNIELSPSPKGAQKMEEW